MNILIDGAPNTVEIGGKRWKVNTDFRVFLLLEDLIRTDVIPDRGKTGLALAYFYPKIPEDINAAVDRLIWFYHCGEEDEEGKEGAGKGGTVRPVYSFRQDAADIYAEFWEKYRIDLTADRLHWWKFNALLQKLVSGVGFSDIVRFRAMKIPKGMSREEADYYRKMKKAYALSGEDGGVKRRYATFDEFKAEMIKGAEARREEARKQAKKKPPG